MVIKKYGYCYNQKAVCTLLFLCLFSAMGARVFAQSDKKSKDTLILQESTLATDISVNEYLERRLKPIKANFKKINSATRWTKVKKVLIEAGEGGYTMFYYKGNQLQKIVTRQYGETFQQLNEYYLLKGQLSFVREQQCQYNRPIYYDSTAMRAYNDTEAFRFDDSSIEENRSYFEKGVLTFLTNSQDCGAPFASDYLQEEEKRIKADYEGLLHMEKNK